jgi:DNA-binding NtrC family response regulator
MDATFRAPSQNESAANTTPSPAAERIPRPDALLGNSPVIQQLRGQIQRIAPYFRTAMLTGERYCGDAATADLLHRLSPLAHRPLITLNAADAELMLGESFPSSTVLDAGMLYLTWPERLSRSAQMTLLRLLRHRKSPPPRIVIFAEHGLRPLVSTGNFSPELEASLSALRITLPSLRDRVQDVPALLHAYLAHAAARASRQPPELSPSLLEAAMQHPWPSNLRDISAVATLLLGHEPGSAIDADGLRAALETIPVGPPVDRRAVRMIRLDQVIQEHVRAVLLACNGNKLRAAEVLGISRSTLYRMLESPTAATAINSLRMAG